MSEDKPNPDGIVAEDNSVEINHAVKEGKMVGYLLIACLDHQETWILHEQFSNDIDEIVSHFGMDREPHRDTTCHLTGTVIWDFEVDGKYMWENRKDR